MKESQLGTAIGWLVMLILAGATLALIVFGVWVYSSSKIWRQNITGQANLKQQEWEKQIIVEQAKAELEEAKLKAEAEVERAKGIAEANEIIGESLKENEEYLKYLMIDQMSDMDTSLIYIPTEAGLPILEAAR